jgi:hypothetical protein
MILPSVPTCTGGGGVGTLWVKFSLGKIVIGVLATGLDKRLMSVPILCGTAKHLSLVAVFRIRSVRKFLAQPGSVIICTYLDPSLSKKKKFRKTLISTVLWQYSTRDDSLMEVDLGTCCLSIYVHGGFGADSDIKRQKIAMNTITAGTV